MALSSLMIIALHALPVRLVDGALPQSVPPGSTFTALERRGLAKFDRASNRWIRTAEGDAALEEDD